MGEEGYRIEVTVVEEKGNTGACPFGYRVGDRILFDLHDVKGEICPTVLNGIWPVVYAMRFGAEFPWMEDRDIDFYACPDRHNPLVFQLRRIRH